jgi:sugar lactone lactonase YvrE
MIEIELVLDARANLGESPVWDDRSGVLMWVDIMAGAVHRYDPRSGADSVTEVGQPVGAIAPRTAGGYVLALRDGIAVMDDDGALGVVSDVEKDVPANRFNDAKCDTAGRFWAGTMAFDVTPGAATLYRIDPDGTTAAMVRDVTLSNGLGWSPDDSTMYYIDSLAYGLDAFDFDVASGTLSSRRRLITCDPKTDGLPDGMAVDAEGNLWIAFYGSGAVRRYTPAGKLDHVLALPVSQPTCVAFGGEDLGDLYITTANQEKSPEALAKEPILGGLFRARPGVSGLPANGFAG